MSQLSFLERLLNGVDVGWKPLESVAKIKHGKDWKNLNSGDVPVYGSGGIMGYVDTYSYNKPTVLIPRKGSITNIFYVDSPFWNVDTIYFTEIDDTKMAPKFFYYFIKTIDLLALDTGSGRPSLTQAILNKIEVPVPPLNIQTEIVRILDAFTELTAVLTAVLTAELTARKKQYNYYRDQLLTFNDKDVEVEWKTLGELSKKISSGGTPKTGVSEYYGGDIPWLRTQEVNFGEIWNTGVKITEAGLRNSSAKWIPENCVIVAMYGATVGKIGINKISMATNQACANINLDENVANYRYVFHFLSSQYEYLKSLGAGSQTNINAQIVKNIKVPIPFPSTPEKSIAEQARIAEILDRFDTLSNSITEGLPREIALRQQQYEFYRDLLLRFPKPDVEA